MTPEERKLVDDAIAAGRVRYIPHGVSGLDPAAPPTFGRHYRPAGKVTQQPRREIVRRARSDRSKEINDQLRTLLTQGLTYRQMGERIGLAPSAVYNRCQMIRCGA